MQFKMEHVMKYIVNEVYIKQSFITYKKKKRELVFALMDSGKNYFI